MQANFEGIPFQRQDELNFLILNCRRKFILPTIDFPDKCICSQSMFSHLDQTVSLLLGDHVVLAVLRALSSQIDSHRTSTQALGNLKADLRVSAVQTRRNHFRWKTSSPPFALILFLSFALNSPASNLVASGSSRCS